MAVHRGQRAGAREHKNRRWRLVFQVVADAGADDGGDNDYERIVPHLQLERVSPQGLYGLFFYVNFC